MSTKRDKHEGSIRLRADGRYEVRLMVDGVQHSRYARTKEMAREILDALKRERGVLGALPKQIGLHALLDQWLRMGEQYREWSPNTIVGYKRAVSLIKAHSPSSLRLEQITTPWCNQLYANFDDRPRQRLYVHQTLHAALAWACQMGYLSRNPSAFANKPKQRAKGARPRQLWTPQQTQTFILRTQDDFYWPLYVTMLATGLRLGELAALRWEDVQERELYGERYLLLNVERSLVLVEGIFHERAPKTPSGLRHLFVDALVNRALRRQREEQARWRLIVSDFDERNKENRLFTSRLGSPLNRHNLWRRLRSLCEREGLPPLNPYALRHIYASLVLQGGAPLTLVTRMMGHSSPKITAEFYAHWLDDLCLQSEYLQKMLPEVYDELSQGQKEEK